MTTTSIIIPALDAEKTVGHLLDALVPQLLPHVVDVIVADNGSSDDTRTIAAAYADCLPVRVIDASARRGPAAARNLGAAAAAGEKLLFCDADDVAFPDWVAQLSGCVTPGTIAVGATLFVDFGRMTVPHEWRPRSERLPRYLGQVPLASSNNLGVSRADFERLHGFDESLRCGEDADFGIRAREAGFRVHSCPAARIAARDRATSRSQFRQFVEYGRWDVTVYRKHRGRALHRPPLSDPLRDYASLVVHVGRLLHPERRRSWIVTAGLRIGRIIGSVKERTLLL